VKDINVVISLCFYNNIISPFETIHHFELESFSVNQHIKFTQGRKQEDEAARCWHVSVSSVTVGKC
jgi:hypothetical protein